MKTKSQLRWSDAWLLAAIYIAGKDEAVAIEHIIAAADYINHAIPNYEELGSGLIRLEEHSLIVRVTNDLCFRCSAEALNVIGECSSGNQSPYQLRKALEARLHVSQWVPAEPLPHPENRMTYPGLTTEVYDSAVAAYLKKTA